MSFDYQNIDDVEAQLRAAGLELDLGAKAKTWGGHLVGSVYVDSLKSIRCNVRGEKKKGTGAYWLKEFQLADGMWLRGAYWIDHGSSSFAIELSKQCAKCGTTMKIGTLVCPKEGCGSKKAKARVIPPEVLEEQKRQRAEERKAAEAQAAAAAARAAQWANAVWLASREITDIAEHDYLARKQLASAHGARIFESNEGVALDGADADDYSYLARFHGALVVPMCDAVGRRKGLQFIFSRAKHQAMITAAKGRDKEYWPGGMDKGGAHFLIGGAMHGHGLVAEGFATAATLHEACGLPVAVAFDAGSLLPVGESIWKAAKKKIALLFCADDDWLQKCHSCGKVTPVSTPSCAHCANPHSKQNAGVAKANEAARAVGGAVVLPVFSSSRPTDRKGPTDFNDLRCAEGLASVAAQIGAKLTEIGAGGAGGHGAPPAGRGVAQNGGAGEGGDGAEIRQRAVSILALDDAVDRFIFIDDDTGEFVFDTLTRNVCKRTKLIKMLAAGCDEKDVKAHPQWRKRAVYIDQIGFDPGGVDANIVCNRWQGWPTVPKAGSCEILLDLLHFICRGEQNPDDLYGWVLKWLAYPLQHPGAKMHSAVVVHGPQGTGKSRFFEAYARIYGDYSIILTQGAIEDKFNADWSERKLFVLADEIVANAEKYHLKNQLKNFITSDWVRVNPKNVAAHRERNHMNMVFLSNEIQPVVLENDDRRHCVIYTPPKMMDSFYAELTEEIDAGGIEALHHFLLNLDLGDFKPWTKPPMTEAKRRLIAVGAGSEEQFIQEWKHGHLDIPFCPIGKATLFSEYMSWCRRENEMHARTSKYFWSYVERLGWYVGVTDRLQTLNALPSDTVSWRCCIPSAEVMEEVAKDKPRDRRCKVGQMKSEWLAECFYAVDEAISKRGNVVRDRFAA